MFNMYDNNELFSWDSIGDINLGRKNLGQDMPVFIYRMLQYTIKDVLIKEFGNDKAIDIFRKSGELGGMEFAKNVLDLTLPINEFLAHLQEVLEQNKVGILRVEKFDEQTGEATLTVAEDLDCSGLPITGTTVCNYDEGFLAGILKAYTHADYTVKEIDCWSTGSRVCRFNAKTLVQIRGNYGR
ncbi:MAG: V4R domain-containing protein [Oscillospiraceae bacterium]